jgi:hypothetical protein
LGRAKARPSGPVIAILAPTGWAVSQAVPLPRASTTTSSVGPKALEARTRCTQRARRVTWPATLTATKFPARKRSGTPGAVRVRWR